MKSRMARHWALSVGTASSLLLAPLAVPSASAAGQGPIKIGVVAEESTTAGMGIVHGTQLAVDAVNAKGGVNGRKVEVIAYDDHISAADAVRAYQRLVEQDHVNVVLVTFTSEVALAVEPWAARLHTPTITPGAASDLITKQIHDNYNRYKYMFEGELASTLVAQTICDSAHDLLVNGLHMKSAAIVSEDADWTKPYDEGLEKCLPKAGLRVVDTIRFNPDTTDFTPIFNQVEGKHPSVMITGWSHVGLQPTVQWAASRVPILPFGVDVQAGNNTFWAHTHGATEGVVTVTTLAPGVALTPVTLGVAKKFETKYHQFPAYTGFNSYDDAMAFLQAIQRAHSTDPDKIVAQMEKTDMVGSSGRIAFYGRKSPFTHDVRYGPNWTTGILLQWQHGKQVCIWPARVCSGKLELPSFVKAPDAASK